MTFHRKAGIIIYYLCGFSEFYLLEGFPLKKLNRAVDRFAYNHPNFGIPNLMKYATGQDPLKPYGSVTKVTLEEGEDGCLHLVLRWPVNPQATDVKHEVEASTDLVDWISLGEVETAGKTAAEFWDAEPVRESGMERRFLRLKVTRE